MSACTSISSQFTSSVPLKGDIYKSPLLYVISRIERRRNEIGMENFFLTHGGIQINFRLSYYIKLKHNQFIYRGYKCLYLLMYSVIIFYVKRFLNVYYVMIILIWNAEGTICCLLKREDFHKVDKYDRMTHTIPKSPSTFTRRWIANPHAFFASRGTF